MKVRSAVDPNTESPECEMKKLVLSEKRKQTREEESENSPGRMIGGEIVFRNYVPEGGQRKPKVKDREVERLWGRI